MISQHLAWLRGGNRRTLDASRNCGIRMHPLGDAAIFCKPMLIHESVILVGVLIRHLQQGERTIGDFML